MGLAVLREVLLGEAEVGELEVAVDVDEDVLRLHIAVENVVLVQVLDSQYHFGDQQFRLLRVEVTMLLDHVEQVTAWAEVQNEVNIVLRMESGVKLHDERVRVLVELAENVSLADYLLDAVQVSVCELLVAQPRVLLIDQLHDLALMNDFHGVQLPSVPLADHEHLREGAFAQHLNDREVAHREVLLPTVLLALLFFLLDEPLVLEGQLQLELWLEATDILAVRSGLRAD